MKRLLLVLGAMLLLVLTAAPEAHPSANAFVIIRVPGDGRIDVEITAHAESLALVDQLTTGTPTSSALALSAEVLRSLGRDAEAAKRDVLAEAVRASERPAAAMSGTTGVRQ